MLESKSLVIDDDEADSRDLLLSKAIEHARKIAANDPELAAQGFSLLVTNERGKVLFQVACSLEKPAVTLH